MTMVMLEREARRASRQAHDSVLEILDAAGRVSGRAARLVDVSSRGASFTTVRAFVKGARIHARMRLLNAGVLEIMGKVVRIEEKANFTRYAVEFDPAPGELR